MNKLEKTMIYNEMIRKLETDNKNNWSFEEIAEIMERRANIPRKETFRILNEIADELKEKKQ